MALTDSIEARNAKAQAIADLCNQGTTNANAQLIITDDTDTALVTLDMSDPAFGDASSGAITANTITNAQVDTEGTASAFKVVNRDGLEVYEGSVGTDSSADLTLPGTQLAVGDYVNIDDGSFTRTEPQ